MFSSVSLTVGWYLINLLFGFLMCIQNRNVSRCRRAAPASHRSSTGQHRAPALTESSDHYRFMVLRGQFVFACRREKTTHPEVALDLSPTIVTGTTVGVSYCFHSTKKK
ncbi:hypothetical protein PVAP13_9KG621550 [Panicum virgatum]|uniref:Uncharacterized protein n=1 Tax=Panicum virgatum TaxID=38727 RepID=A0A8T0NV14_PANVG|nr:hypothetical protein PVAP13_9KG621550 [Panicum virgatum]